MAASLSLISVPKFIQGYNGKPALVTKSGTFKRHENYIEFTINVNMWAFLAKKGLYTLTPTFPDFITNIGFTIEARCDEEMPGKYKIGLVFVGNLLWLNFSAKYQTFCVHNILAEVLLGGCRMLNLDPEQAAVDGVDV